MNPLAISAIVAAVIWALTRSTPSQTEKRLMSLAGYPNSNVTVPTPATSTDQNPSPAQSSTPTGMYGYGGPMLPDYLMSNIPPDKQLGVPPDSSPVLSGPSNMLPVTRYQGSSTVGGAGAKADCCGCGGKDTSCGACRSREQFGDGRSQINVRDQGAIRVTVPLELTRNVSRYSTAPPSFWAQNYDAVAHSIFATEANNIMAGSQAETALADAINQIVGLNQQVRNSFTVPQPSIVNTLFSSMLPGNVPLQSGDYIYSQNADGSPLTFRIP